MSDDFSSTGSPPSAPPTADSTGAAPPKRRSSNGVVGWVIATVVVLVLAIAGGLFTAWIVANMRAVPGPIAGASPTPAASHVAGASPSASAGASGEPTEAPRRTPTAIPTVEVTPAPFVYVVQPGDHLVNIAAQFQVSVQDIIDLNGITNANRIAVGQELLIPGYGVQPTSKPTKPPR